MRAAPGPQGSYVADIADAPSTAPYLALTVTLNLAPTLTPTPTLGLTLTLT